MQHQLKLCLTFLLCILLMTGCNATAESETITPVVTTFEATAPTMETEPANEPSTAPALEAEPTTEPTTAPVLVTEPTTAPTTATISPTEPIQKPSAVALYPEMEQQVLQLMNEHRVQAGADPLQMAYGYYDCAEIRARECMIHWSHTRPDGRRWSTVYADLGLSEGLLLQGENLARHFQTAEDMVQALMDSPSHRRNILNPTYQYVAISIVPVENYEGLYAMAQLFIQKEE